MAKHTLAAAVALVAGLAIGAAAPATSSIGPAAPATLSTGPAAPAAGTEQDWPFYGGDREAAHLPQQPVPADLPRRGHRSARGGVRRRRHARRQPRPRLGDQQEALYEHVAAGRLQGSRDPRQRRRRSSHLQERSAGRR